ncbi:hypothetical protein [Microbacterium elymi]|uniref:AAA family ATPase n=1 Tax=Microbacterium elymi TaxID=2909587 RepID=A0ABY5NKI6_9MICO|nr:hypothetical protein [Microbacterium elymi]UUT35649.1 hypothetical protein L2X98_20475 [Microbacterium elymi]
MRQLTAHIPSFSVRPRLIVSTFGDIGARMSRDLARLDHPVLNALGGHRDDRELLALHRARPAVTDPDERPPASDTFLLDADAEQEDVLARITDGQSLVVHTLPGTGGTQTVINALGALIDDGKRVLVVSARRSTLEGVRHRLAGIGLGGLAVSPVHLRRDLIRAIGRNEKAAQPRTSDIDDALVRLRTVLRDYRRALTADRSELGVSALEIVRELTALAATHQPAAATTRFDSATLERLKNARAEAADKLVAAARLGEFRFGPDDSAWYGVTFGSTEDARAAHALARRLASRGRAGAARARVRADRADAHAAVRHDRRARRVPAAPAGHPRLARQVQPDGVRTGADRAHPGARSAPRRRASCRRPTADGCVAWPASTCARACTCPTCTSPSCGSSASAPSGRGTPRRHCRPRASRSGSATSGPCGSGRRRGWKSWMRSSGGRMLRACRRCRPPVSCAAWRDWPPIRSTSTT